MHWHAHEQLDPAVLNMVKREFPFLFKENIDSADPTPIIELMKKENVEKGFVINYVAPEVMGFTFKTNEWVIDFCDKSEGMLIPVGGVDTKSHENAGELLRPYLETKSIKLVKVHGPHQLIKPNEYLTGNKGLQNLYETCQELKIPVIIHTGTSIFPKARSRYGHPLYVEDILIDFPDLKIIIAHGGRPFWTMEFEYLMQKFKNILFDISGVPPKLLPNYFPRFHRYADRVIYGSDFPSPGVKGIRKNAELLNSIFDKMGLNREVKSKIFYENANKLIKT